MKTTILKSTFREIKKNLSRWIAIFAICALGVGFFSGLKVCRQDFIKTGNDYLAETNFYDYRLISSLGLVEKDVQKISQIQGVNAAEGSYCVDAVFEEEGSMVGTKAAKFHSISDIINKPSLTSGEMPKKSNECIVDDQKYNPSDIGKVVKISKSNKKDTLDFFRYDEYVITGLIQSPLYLNYERGTTSLGDGSVACFIFIPPEGFKSDCYTDIYVDLQGKAEIYSEEYKNISKSINDPLKEALEECAEKRYESILAEAEDQLSKARTKVDQGEKELQENQDMLLKSTSDLLEGRVKYNKALEDYKSNKDAVYAQLEQLKLKADSLEGTPYYEEYISRYNSQKDEADAQFASSWNKLEDTRKSLSQGESEILQGEQQLDEGKEKLADAKEKLKDAEKEIQKIKKPTTYVLDRNSNIGYVCFDNDTSIVDSVAKVFPIFFFLVAALVCMTTMTRMIDDQRTQIGVLKALGYGKFSILNKYVFYSASASLIGGLLGFLIGIYLFPSVIWKAYGMMYQFASLSFVTDWTLGALSVALAVLCCVGTTVFCCYHELENVPAQLIRPKSPPIGKRIILEKIHFIWDRLKFLYKVSLRNIFRYKKRFFMMVLGISGCTALLITGFGLSDSIKNVVNKQYDEIIHSDYTITFDGEISEDDREEFLKQNDDIISDALFLNTLSVDARINGEVKSSNMVVCDSHDNTEKFITLRHDSKTIPYPDKGKCVINANLASKLSLKQGDTICLYDSDMREMKAVISDLCDNYIYNYVYINKETFESQWGSAGINSALVIGKANPDGVVENPHEDGASIMDTHKVASVSITHDLRNRVDNMMKSLDYVVGLIIFSAGALAFIVLYNLTNINITERIREIATIKVLGFYPSETNSYVFRENIFLTAISALAGIPLGKVLHSFVMKNIQIDWLSFDIHIEISSYLISIALTFIFTFLVNLVMYFKLNKISMTESLKSIE